MDKLDKRVLTSLAQAFFRPTSAEELATDLHLPLPQVESALANLVATGIIEEYAGDYFFNPESDIVAGYFQAHVKGYGFVHVGDDRQYYVGPGAARGAKDGDIVLGEVVLREPGKAPMLKITDFLFRGERLIAGRFSGKGGLGNIQEGNKKIMIPPRAAHGATDGDCVLAAVSGWEGRVVNLLETTDVGRLDLLNIAVKKGILPVFPPAVEAEAAKLNSSIDLGNRLDLRDEVVVTVDGESAKDLDDGFSLAKLENGNWRLGVHIADVASYVHRGSGLDKEALKRGLSVYLLDREVPMLPARLSRDLCSLLPGEDRPAMSCIVQLTPTGEVVEFQFAETVIRSRGQLTYTQVDEGRCGLWNDLAANASQLVEQLKRRRRKQGAAYISLPATAITLDAEGRPLTMGQRPTGGSRELVEEFMVLANELAAEYLHGKGITFLYRGNEGFQLGRGEGLKAFMARWELDLDYPPSALELQRLLDTLEQRPEKIPVSRQLARCLQKSRYSSAPMGHYNLGVERYVHFSSPIRRYSDLFTHRLIKQALKGGSSIELDRDLPRVAEQCSFRERLAQDVEAECLNLKKLQYLEHCGDQVFPGQVMDTTGGGPLVLLDNTAEGVVVAGAPKEVLADYSPGDRIEVRVHKLDYNAKQIFFALATLDKSRQ